MAVLFLAEDHGTILNSRSWHEAEEAIITGSKLKASKTLRWRAAENRDSQDNSFG